MTSITYTATLDVGRETAETLARLLREHRERLGTRRGTRALGVFKQGVLVLRWFVDGTRLAQLARDNRVSVPTAYRYLHEGLTVLADHAPDLSTALERAAAAGHTHLNLDGTVIRTDRVAAPGPNGADLWWSGKHKHHGGHVQVISNYRVTLDRVRGKLGNLRLQELTEDHVVEWMRWALQGGRVRGMKAGMVLGVTSVDMSLARLKDALNRAVTRGLVTVNVASEVHIPLKARKAERKTKAVVQPWNASEVGAFVAVMKVDRLYAPLLLSLMGLRPAEVCGLRWSDIDLHAGTLSIANTPTMMGNRTVVEKDTKSMAGERVLPLPNLAREALKAFRATQAVERLAAGEGYEGAGYVLVDELGAALNARQLRVRAYKIMDENGLRRVRLYDARASCLTYLANNGVPDHLLAMWAGHTNVKTTKKWYVKPDVADLLPAAEAWGGLAGDV